jgi:hypothetical protein
MLGAPSFAAIGVGHCRLDLCVVVAPGQIVLVLTTTPRHFAASLGFSVARIPTIR